MKFKAGPTAFSYPKGPLIIYYREGGVGGFCYLIPPSIEYYRVFPPPKKKKKKGNPFPGDKLKLVTNVNE